MSNLLEKLKKSGSIKDTLLLSESKFFNIKDTIPTNIPIINIALSGSMKGGLSSGLTFIAGESKNFKSLLGLMLVKAYLNKYEDAICLFYDSEFGITPEYIQTNGIDTNRVLHIPIEHLEQLKFDISKRLESIDRDDRVIIFVDSVGNLASKKEVEDALDGKSVADMSRAKVMKSLWRIVTPHLTIKDIPCVAINHTYQTMEMYSKPIMSGGTGGMYSSNKVLFISKAQDKDKTSKELLGYDFTINIEKSRLVKEKSKFTFNVKFDGGINKWSGLLDLAIDVGLVVKPSQGWYSKVNQETGEIEDKKYREKETNNREFWKDIISNEKFNIFIEEKYQLSKKTKILDVEEDEVE